MLALPKVVMFSLLTLFFPQAATNPKQELNDQLFEAVRKGDVAAVTAALDKGADVNAKFRYGSTALFKAAERGNAEITKILLDRGADVKVKDTFYGATAMSWAIDGKHIEVVRLILQKSPEDVDDVLLNGAREGNPELLKLALDRGGSKAESMTVALAVASADEKKAALADALKNAGAKPPAEVDAATLQSYAGKYKGDPGPELIVTVKDGKLTVAFGRDPQPLVAIDKTTFVPLTFGGVTLVFNSDAGKVVSFSLKQGTNTTVMKRTGDVNP